MIAARLVALSAGITLVLGVLHLLYTFSGPKLLPRDPALQAAMATVHPVITEETTIWRVWLGVNATHSMALILFGLVFGYLALAQDRLLFASPYLLGVGLAVLAGLALLCRLYFFSAPLVAVTVALLFYVLGLVLARA